MEESEPMVELAGESSELDASEWWSSHFDFNLYNLERKGDKYYLKSPRFVKKRDSKAIREEDKSKAIWEEAKNLLPVIKAISKIRGLGGQSMKIGSEVRKEWGRPADVIVEGGRPHLFIFGELLSGRGRFWKEDGIIYFRGHETGRVVNEHDQIMQEFMRDFGNNIPDFALNIPQLEFLVQQARQLDSDLNLLEKCVDDPYVYETFSYFAGEPNWLNLWKTYEMIKYCVDRNLGHTFTREKCAIIDNGWAEELELVNFANSANYYLAQGDPRHSRAYYLNKERETEEKLNPAQKQSHRERKARREAANPPMSLPMAEELIIRIFRRWCRWRVTNMCLESYQHVIVTI